MSKLIEERVLIMKVYVIKAGTRVALGNGDGKLKVFVTEKELSFMGSVTDPIYYHNNVSNKGVFEEINEDPTIRAKGDTVAKYPLDEKDVKSTGYKFLYISYSDVEVLC